jgi:hypothetical protein
MSNIQPILTRAQRLGLQINVEGNRIAIFPKRCCPKDLLADFKEHKGAIIELLEQAQTSGLAPDCTPWLHVARQILAGEFDAPMDNSVRGSLEIGLRSIIHPVCQRALARLKQIQNN